MRRWVARITLLFVALSVCALVLGEGYRIYRQSVIRAWTRISLEIGIESLERIHLGGVEQWILIRGQNTRNPLLLWIQGGPGLPVFPWVRLIGVSAGIEHDFNVVYWEQRGAGKSAAVSATPQALTIANFVSDVCELGTMLKKRFDDRKVYVAAHSWGTIPGLLAIRKCPELFEAYVGIGQIVDKTEQERLSTAFIRAAAEGAGDRNAIESLRIIGNPPLSAERQQAQRALLGKYAGVDARRPPSMLQIYKDIVQTPEYSLSDLIRMAVYRADPQRALVPETFSVNFLRAPLAVKIPVYLLQGRKDMLTPGVLTEMLLQHMDAAAGKELIWFEEAAHMTPLEDPDGFRKALRRVRDRPPAVTAAPPPPPPQPPPRKKRKGPARKRQP